MSSLPSRNLTRHLLANVTIMLAGQQNRLKYGYAAPEIIITHSEDEYGGLYAAVVSVLYSELGTNDIATIIDTIDSGNLVNDIDALRKLYKVSQAELAIVRKGCMKNLVFGSTPCIGTWARELV
jgi:hypothetical protein